ncbi:MAG TPA: DUF4177 domain-containing protein [Oscillospiraceae bacterium]|nr:DUF4177 domain-containing protein [Oscillospiraceae bacterium]
MYRYEYVTVRVGRLIGAGNTEHRQIIDDYARQGWRWAGFVPTNMTDHGKFRQIDLIFEKQA